MEPIPPLSPAEPAKAYAQLDAFANDGLQLDTNLSHMVSALQSSEAAGGMVKPHQADLLQVLSEPEIDQGELMAASIRLNSASNDLAVLQSAVTTIAAIPNKLLKLGGGG
jgi:hypothetical protein